MCFVFFVVQREFVLSPFFAVRRGSRPAVGEGTTKDTKHTKGGAIPFVCFVSFVVQREFVLLPFFAVSRGARPAVVQKSIVVEDGAACVRLSASESCSSAFESIDRFAHSNSATTWRTFVRFQV